MDPVDAVVNAARAQAPRLASLDAALAEAWASDLVGLAREADPVAGVARIHEALARDTTTHLAARAVAAVTGMDTDAGSVDDPPWAATLGTAVVTEAVEMTAPECCSVALRCEMSDGAAHAVVVDLVTDRADSEQLGELHVVDASVVPFTTRTAGVADKGEPPERFGAAELGVRSLLPVEAARRVAAALAATDRPSSSALANGAVLVSRLRTLLDRVPDVAVGEPGPERELPPRSPDDDRYALGVARSALGAPTPLSETGPDLAAALADSARRVREAESRGEPLAGWLEAGRGRVALDTDDAALVAAVVAATISPHTLRSLQPEEADAVSLLEWADWLGAVIELVRAGPGASVDPEGMVDRVNRCREVTTSIPARDRVQVAWAFAVVTGSWWELGLVDDEGALTDLGAWLLPHALEEAWGNT